MDPGTVSLVKLHLELKYLGRMPRALAKLCKKKNNNSTTNRVQCLKNEGQPLSTQRTQSVKLSADTCKATKKLTSQSLNFSRV